MSATATRVSPLGAGGLALVLGLGLAGVVVVQGTRSPRDLALMLVAAALTGLGFLSARFAITASIATFAFSALVRRVVPAADAAVDPAAVTPFLVALPLAIRGLRAHKPIAVALLVAWASLSATASFSRPLVGLGGWLAFCVPLLAAFGIHSIPTGLRTFARSTVTCGALASTYGIVQYFIPFRWDEKWLTEANFVSVGQFGKSTFRPFGTLPAPGTAAALAAVVVLLLLFRRDLFEPSRAVRGWALTASIVFVLLAQVRSVWLALGLAIIVGTVTKTRRSVLGVFACAAIVTSVLVVAPPGEVIASRWRTLTDIQADPSFRGRFALIKQFSELLSPFGTGLGSRSAASRVERDQTIDNGYLIVLAETGLVGLTLLGWTLIWIARRGRKVQRPFLAFLLLDGLAGFAFGGLIGFLLWPLCIRGSPSARPGGDGLAATQSSTPNALDPGTVAGPHLRTAK